VSFTRADDGYPVHIVPEHVVKLESLKNQLFTTRVVTTVGAAEVVEGSPSEVAKKLRNGQ
jgi:hypothetical protein